MLQLLEDVAQAGETFRLIGVQCSRLAAGYAQTTLWSEDVASPVIAKGEHSW